jgi:hypothetical protein
MHQQLSNHAAPTELGVMAKVNGGSGLFSGNASSAEDQQTSDQT